MDPIDRPLQLIFATEWHVFVIIGILLIGVAELGFRIGHRLHAERDEARTGQISGVQGAILGILGLLLGFTFAMAVSRYEIRRELVVTEANAIGTTYLRADFLPESHREAVKDLLRQYVEVRLQLQPTGAGTASVEPEIRWSAELEAELWKHTRAVAAEVPTPITATFVTTLNEMIDTDAERLASVRYRIPGAVWLLLLLVAAFGCFTSGYRSGANGARSGFTGAVLPLLITIVVVLIFDLMHPKGGAIGISQQPLLDLKASIAVPEA
jgi:hypothetical protein